MKKRIVVKEAPKGVEPIEKPWAMDYIRHEMPSIWEAIQLGRIRSHDMNLLCNLVIAGKEALNANK